MSFTTAHPLNAGDLYRRRSDADTMPTTSVLRPSTLSTPAAPRTKESLAYGPRQTRSVAAEPAGFSGVLGEIIELGLVSPVAGPPVVLLLGPLLLLALLLAPPTALIITFVLVAALVVLILGGAVALLAACVAGPYLLVRRLVTRRYYTVSRSGIKATT